MKCFIEYYEHRDLYDWISEWKFELLDGKRVGVGEEMMEYGCVDSAKIQVYCEANFNTQEVLVTRVGPAASTDHTLSAVPMDCSVSVPKDSTFSLLGNQDIVKVLFTEDEEESEGMDEVYYDGEWYDPDSHSLSREIRRNDMDEGICSADEFDEIAMDE